MPRLVSVAVLTVGLCDCSKPVARQAPDSSEPLPSSSPATSSAGSPATNVPAAPGKTTVASKNTYYVIKRFSVMSESGVTGFAVGKPVTLIKETETGYVITDGVVQTVAPKRLLTNDLHVLNVVLSTGEVPAATPSLVATTPVPADSQATKFQEAKRKIARNKAKFADEKKQADDARKKKKLEAELVDLDKRIKAAQAEIADKKATQRPIRRTYDAWGNLISYQGRSMYTLSADASGLTQLIAKRDKTAEQLAELE